MRAVVFNEGLRYDPVREMPEPGIDELLVRVTVCGICNTDLEIIKGYSGFTGILGHEFCGVVESGGPLQGKRVVGEINIGCRSCELCRDGLQNHCAKRTVLGIIGKDGAMADYLTLPPDNLHCIPEAISDQEAVFVEPLAAALQVVEQVKPDPETRVLVMGDGKLGILCALVLKLSCKNVTLAGKHSDKLEIVQHSGITTTHKNDPGSKEGFFDLVVEATGSANGLSEALAHVRPRGTVVLKSTTVGQSRLCLAPIVVNEIGIVGSRCGPFPKAISVLAGKKVNVKPLISASYPVEMAMEAFEHASRKEAMKILLTLNTA